MTLAAVAALAVGGCGGSSGSPSAAAPDTSPPASAAPSSAGPQSYTVLVDGHTQDNKAAFLAYFPKQLSVHPGDSVTFHSAYSGEPHTVALGSVVTTAVNKVEALLKQNPKAFDNGPPPAELQKIPQLLPDGPGDAIQAGAQPCVVTATGTLPKSAACPTRTAPAFDGTEQLVSSGWLGVDEDWTITIAANAKPGAYRIICQLHGPEMTGTLTVVDPATPVKDPAAVQAEGDAERAAAVQKLQPALAELAKATPAKALAGALSPAVQNAFITEFGPSDVKIPVGGSVTWTVLGAHSIAFNAPADAQSLRQPGADGSVHLSQKAVMPAGGPGADPAAQRPPPVINGGSWNGSGFRNSGIIFGGPPPESTAFRLRFTKAGTYPFICTLHPDMKGTVTVG